MPFEVFDFPFFEDSRGTLVPVELDDKFPFPLKRIYWVTAKDHQTRGGHAHQQESEIFVAINGTIKAVVNDGTGDQIILLDKPNKALLVKPYCWHEFCNFSEGAVMLCLSSTHYFPGENNYILEKEKFYEILRSRKKQNLTKIR